MKGDTRAISLVRELTRLFDDAEATGLTLMRQPESAAEGQRLVAEVLAARDGLLAGLRELVRGWMLERLAVQARLHETVSNSDHSAKDPEPGDRFGAA